MEEVSVDVLEFSDRSFCHGSLLLFILPPKKEANLVVRMSCFTVTLHTDSGYNRGIDFLSRGYII